MKELRDRDKWMSKKEKNVTRRQNNRGKEEKEREKMC